MDRVCALCRRQQEKLFLKGDKCFTPKCPVSRRNYPPGIHGQKPKSKPSEFSLQLREKQKIKCMYGMRERQFRNLVEVALEQKGNTSALLASLLERRLDNVVLRLGLAKSHAQARQLVNHGHFLVNGNVVSVPSYRVEEGDRIEIKKVQALENATNVLKENLNALKTEHVPGWLFFDAASRSGKVVRAPSTDDIPYTANMKLIVEFYSR